VAAYLESIAQLEREAMQRMAAAVRAGAWADERGWRQFMA